MIIAELSGGLGNQMFEYACGYAVSHSLQVPFCYYHTHSSGNTPRSLELGCFELTGTLLGGNTLKRLVRHKHLQQLSQRLFHLSLPYLTKVYQEQMPSYDKNVFMQTDNTLFVGYWQSHKYFEHLRDEIKNEFVFKGQLTAESARLKKMISNSESISLHIRRGDYVSSSAAASFHGTLPPDYYYKAIEIIRRKVSNPSFFIFSDDIEWVKHNLKIDGLKHYVQNNTSPDNYYQDLQLMSLCNHNIIANSSFSWWAAWLNDHPKKLIVAPKNWFISGSLDTRDRFPRGWITL